MLENPSNRTILILCQEFGADDLSQRADQLDLLPLLSYW